MKTNLIKIAGTAKYPYACIIEIDDIWVTDRICNEDKTKNLIKYTEKCNDIKSLKMKLALLCIELRMKYYNN